MLTISTGIWDKFLQIARIAQQQYKSEVQWWGRVQKEGSKLIVVDYAIPHQLVREASVDTTVEQLLQLRQELLSLKSGMTIEEIEAANKASEEWCLWVHSHVTMGAFYSGTDTSTLHDLALATKRPHFGLVLNVKGESKLFLGVPIMGIAKVYEIDKLEIGTSSEVDADLLTLLQSRVTKYVPPVLPLLPEGRAIQPGAIIRDNWKKPSRRERRQQSFLGLPSGDDDLDEKCVYALCTNKGVEYLCGRAYCQFHADVVMDFS